MQKISINPITESKISKVDFDHLSFGKVYSDHMFIAEYDGEWKNFRIEPYKNIELSPANPTLHYGITIFEGMKAYKVGESIALFRPDKNLERMNISAKRMCMPEIPEKLFFDALTELLTLDKAWIPQTEGQSLYIRPFLFSDDDYIGVAPSEKFRFMIITSPVAAYYAQPVKVKIETHYTRAIEGGSGYCKTGCNYGPTLYPAKKAKEEGYDQILWTDGKEHKYIEESGTMNVMFVIDEALITPELGDTILRGITRESVLHLAREWGIKVEERKISVQEVIEAVKNNRLQEAFGVGTAATITSIKSIGYDGKEYSLPDTKQWKVSSRILQYFNELRYGKREDEYNWMYTI